MILYFAERNFIHIFILQAFGNVRLFDHIPYSRSDRILKTELNGLHIEDTLKSGNSRSFVSFTDNDWRKYTALNLTFLFIIENSSGGGDEVGGRVITTLVYPSSAWQQAAEKRP